MNPFRPSGGENTPPEPDPKIQVLESAIQGMKKDQEDLEFKLDQKDAAISKLETSIQLMEEKIQALEDTRKTPAPAQPDTSRQTPSGLYHKARNLLLEGNPSQAAGLFSQFLQNYPDNDLADNAVYWLGECHYTLGEYQKAAAVFKNLELQYPKSEKVPDATLKAGYSYLSLDDTNRAHHYLKKVLKSYPFSPAAEKAEEKLKSFE